MVKYAMPLTCIFFFAFLLSLISGCHSVTDHPQTEETNSSRVKAIPGMQEEALLDPSLFDTTGIQEGDIILKKGRGALSAMIVEKMNERVPVSHCGIFVRYHDSLCIAHAVSKRYGTKDGVQLISVRAFLNDCVKNKTLIIRHKGDEALRKGFARRALHYVAANVPFDIQGQNEDISAMSCAELLYHSTRDAKDISWPRVKVGNVEWLGFSGLQDTSVFMRLKTY